MRKRYMKHIRDINKISWNKVEVDFFDGRINSWNTARRTVRFPKKHRGDGAYINWYGKKKVVESFYL